MSEFVSRMLTGISFYIWFQYPLSSRIFLYEVLIDSKPFNVTILSSAISGSADKIRPIIFHLHPSGYVERYAGYSRHMSFRPISLLADVEQNGASDLMVDPDLIGQTRSAGAERLISKLTCDPVYRIVCVVHGKWATHSSCRDPVIRSTAGEISAMRGRDSKYIISGVSAIRTLCS